MCGVVFDFGSACMDCGKTGEVGTDDFRQRDSAGGRGEYPGAFLRIGNECCRQNLQVDFCVCWVGFRLEEKARRFSLEPWPDRGYPELWGGEKEKRSF